TSSSSAYQGSASAPGGHEGRKKRSDMSLALRHGQHELAGVPVRLHPLLCLRELAERQHALDERADPAIRDCRKHVSGEVAHAPRALLGVAQLVRYAEDPEALRVQCVEVDLGVQHTVDVTDDREAPFEG